MQGPTGSPAASTGMVLAHWPVQETATTRSGEVSARTARESSRTASHQRAASCTAPPPGSRSVSRSRSATAAILPSSETAPALSAPVPRSIATTKRSDRPSRNSPVNLGRDALLRVHQLGHHAPHHLLGLDVQPARDPAIEGGGLGGLVPALT